MVVRPELVVDKGRGGFFFYLKFYGVEWSSERAGWMQWVGIERGEGVNGLSLFGLFGMRFLGRPPNAFANIGCAVQERRWRSI